MLEKVCRHVHNYFVRAAYPDTFTISGGMISGAEVDLSETLKPGQRFMIMNSDLNDGIYTWHQTQNGYAVYNDDNTTAAALEAETFDGVIIAMAPPKDFFDLVSEIGDWQTAYGAKALSPYQSENVIGVYSYTKANGGGDGNGNGSGSPTWESVFASRLNPYRKTGDLL